MTHSPPQASDVIPLSCELPDDCACRNAERLAFQFAYAYQPIVDLASRRVFAHEALGRGARGRCVTLMQGYLFGRPVFRALTAVDSIRWA